MIRVELVEDLLPQTQCRQCGFPGCRAYAEAIAKGEAPINRCPTGGARTIGRLAELLGTEPLPLDPEYGREMPFAVALVKAEGCIGCGWCEDACPVDAITGVPKHLYAVLEADCTGCGLCIKSCPTDKPAVRIHDPERTLGEIGRHYRLGWLEADDPKNQRSAPEPDAQPAEEPAPFASGLDYLNQEVLP